MEEEPQNHEQMNLMNFSFAQHGFEYTYLRAFEFDEDFKKPDPGQIQQEPTALDEHDLLIRLRDEDKRNSPIIPQTIYAFYDNCKKHFYTEFISLLTGLISNIEKTKRLQDHNSEDRLLEFFNVKLDGPLNFGKHQIFVDRAAECDAETKAKLRACGKELQLLVQAGREKTIAAARIKLQACSEDFKTFGEKEWMTQCKKTSHHNILDQHFAVKCFRDDKADTSDDDESGDDEFTKDTDEPPLKLWTASDWLYNAAIHDSKKEVDKEIRRRRAQKLEAQAAATALRARQAEVNVRADAAKPEVTLGDRLKRLDRRLDTVDESLSSIRASSHAQGRTATMADTCPEIHDADPAPLQWLVQKVNRLDKRVQTLHVSAPPDTSKNGTRAEFADTQQPAGKRRRRKRGRTEGTDVNDADATSPTPNAQHTRPRAPQHPQPPTPNHASGNGMKASQQHRTGHQGSQRHTKGPAPTHDSAPQPQDGRKRQDNVQGQPASYRRGQGRGQGQGQGREY